jgi:hypothetical protein
MRGKREIDVHTTIPLLGRLDQLDFILELSFDSQGKVSYTITKEHLVRHVSVCGAMIRLARTITVCYVMPYKVSTDEIISFESYVPCKPLGTRRPLPDSFNDNQTRSSSVRDSRNRAAASRTYFTLRSPRPYSSS